MKAARFHEYGGPEVLKYEDVLKPEIRPGEVLIRVKACALNRIDLWLRSGAYKTTLPHILGSEFAGEVAEVSHGVTRVSIGDRVLIYPGLIDRTCQYCLAGEDSLCENFGIIGSVTDGGYAEYAKVPTINVFPIPESLSFEQAASMPLVFLTAWHMLVTRAKLTVGKTVLIQAVGSGLGSAAIQIAKLAGATVFATASTNEKLDTAEEWGADYLINYSEKNFRDEIMRLTDNAGVDVAFEHTGAVTFPGSLASLKKNGRLVIAGATTGAEAKLDIRQLYNRQLSVIGSMLGTRRELVEILDLAGQGKLVPVIGAVMPLAEAAMAHLVLEQRRPYGKVILKPGDE